MNQKGNTEQKKAILPKIELSKGGGAINTIGEKFSVNAATGTGTASIPIPLSPGRSDFTPSVGLMYDSGAGNSPFGLGWSVQLESISRKTAKGLPKYDDANESDVFVLSGAEDLVPTLDNENNWQRKVDNVSQPDYTIYGYCPRTEGSFSHIEKWVSKSDSSDVHWRVVTPGNVLSIFGLSDSSRITNPSNSQQIFEWLLCESRDNRGNVIQYEYRSENSDHINGAMPSEHYRIRDGKSFAQKYIKTISYGNHQPDIAGEWHFQLVFDYGEHDVNAPTPTDHLSQENKWDVRPDPFSSYRSGFEIRTYRLCKRILMFHQFEALNNGVPTLVRSLDIEHDLNNIASRITRVKQKGYIKKDNGYSSKEMPPVDFGYSQPEVGQSIKSLPRESLNQLPIGLDSELLFVDLEGEGISGILAEKNGGWYYKSNYGNGKFGDAQLLMEQPSLSTNSSLHIRDIEGDGNKEFVVMDERISGYHSYENSEWGNFTPFRKMPTINWQDPNVKLIDLNGDGFADILITEDDLLRWFPSKAKDGYDPAKTIRKKMDEQDGPALVFSDSTQSIYLADMSGDGLTDIVRVRNKEICYWPNMGYAQFGAKVTMNDAPVFDHNDQFNQANIRLADIDGTGPTDILYFNANGAHFWINQSGNGWSTGNKLEQFPNINQVTNVQLVDLLGTGTPCLVWSSPLPADALSPLKYIDLMEPSEQKPLGKPYLLNEIDNNLGKVVRFQYAPSTQFYLRDKAAGTPWITKLHFPVYVIEKIEAIDQIAEARLATSYSYHHGYFDSVEREFRGFGMVEQQDVETFDEFLATNASEEQQAHFVHPILTKSWFHTGAYVKDAEISAHYRTEYFKEAEVQDALFPVDNHLLEDSKVDLIDGAGFEDNREAHRAMRGQMLRQEVYSLDGSTKEMIPYSVTETNFTVRQLQPSLKEQNGVYMSIPNENIIFSYERDCCDPRVAHTLSLEVDKYGTVLKSAEVVYPRRLNNRTLPEEQLTLHIILNEAQVIHADDTNFFSLAIPMEEKSFEIKGISPASTYFSVSELKSELEAIVLEVPFHEFSEPEGVQKRLLSWGQNFLWNQDQSDVLPLGEAEWPLLPHHSEAAIFTPELVLEAYGDKLDQQTLENQGGYVLRDGYWWNPGVITHFKYHDDPNADERNRENPFLFPVETQDPFEKVEHIPNRARVFYDCNNLMVESSDDQEGFTTQSFIDYRTLSPYKMIDINENVNELLSDENGMVIAATSYGTEEKKDRTVFTNGDLPLDQYQVLNPETIHEIIENPHAFLQGASSYYFYDINAWFTRQEPPQYVSVFRETHARKLSGNEQTVVQFGIGYSDGFGREIQQKIKVESGPAHLTDGNGHLLLDDNGNPQKSDVEDRWLASGRNILNNKEKPIRQYEPYYVDSHIYMHHESVPKIGVSSLIHYDPLMRVIRTDTPDGFYSKVEFTPWESSTFDLNDTVKDSEYYNRVMSGEITVSNEEKDALTKAETHHNTPSKAVFDTLGRPFITIETDEEGEDYITRSVFNITGQVLSVTDPRQYDLNKTRSVDEQISNYKHIYDMSGSPLQTESVDAGTTWVLVNVLGNPLLSWSPRGFITSIQYDFMHRPLKIQVEGGNLNKRVTVEKMVYADPLSTSADKNMRGTMVAQYDQSGKNTVIRVGFKGEVLESNKQFVSIFKPAAE